MWRVGLHTCDWRQMSKQHLLCSPHSMSYSQMRGVVLEATQLGRVGGQLPSLDADEGGSHIITSEHMHVRTQGHNNLRT